MYQYHLGSWNNYMLIVRKGEVREAKGERDIIDE
jgi:hypothetical protein